LKDNNRSLFPLGDVRITNFELLAPTAIEIADLRAAPEWFSLHLDGSEVRMSLEVGSTVGDYQIVDILGAGGMGKVYKVRNVISDRVEAMKVLLPDLGHARELADRFLREIKVQASLEHPNIAALHTALRVDNQLLMLMELVEGETLAQKLKAGPIPVSLALDYIRQVLSALEYAHARGVVHRDIKPANMMVTPNGVVKLMDFGIAKAAGDYKLTMTGTTMGSLYYMSPEQITGTAMLDGRADLYSVGVSLYELATGKRPFDGDSQFAIMSAHLEGPVPPIDLNPNSPWLNEIILNSLRKDRNERFQTASAFLGALAAAVIGEPQQPATLHQDLPVATTMTKPPVATRRRWRLAVAVVVAAVVVPLAVVVAANVWSGQGEGVKVLPPSASFSLAAPSQQQAPPAGPTSSAAVVQQFRARAAPSAPARHFLLPQRTAPALLQQTFLEPPVPVIEYRPIVIALPGALNGPVLPPRPHAINAQHVHLLRAPNGVLTLYRQDFRFQEYHSPHLLEGEITKLRPQCKVDESDCTIRFRDNSGHQEVLRVKRTDAIEVERNNNTEQSARKD
jgi:serine/threonine-protein kinase